MRISYRIIFITYITLLLIIGGSGIVYYSITFNVLSALQNKHFLQMAGNFVYAYSNDIEQCDNAFQYDFMRQPERRKSTTSKNVDYVLLISGGETAQPVVLYASRNIRQPQEPYTLYEFLLQNRNLLVRYHKTRTGKEYLYGFAVRSSYFDSLASRMSTDIAVFLDDSLYYYTNPQANRGIRGELKRSFESLKSVKNYTISQTDLDSLYLFSSIYHARESYSGGNRLSILIFSTSFETTNLRSTIQYFLILLFAASLMLSFILAYLFTGKLRKQINSLTRAAESTRAGKLDARAEVFSNDEIGNLALTFNGMLAALKEQERLKEQYTEFLSYVNKTPGIKDIAESALQRIAQATESTQGALFLFGRVNSEEYYFVHETEYTAKELEESKHFQDAISGKTMQRFTDSFHTDQSHPTPDSVYLPILSNDEIIALLYLAAQRQFSVESIEYIHKISEQLSISLTRALAYDKLEHFIQELEIQKRKAEESTELKSRFLAIISHELRTPLSSILGLTDLLLSDKTQHQKALERLNIIQRSGQRLLKLINELLELSKIEAGKMSVAKTEFSIAPFLHDLEQQFTAQAVSKNISISFTSEIPAEVILFTDREKLYQIVSNLIANGIKFTREGDVSIRFSSIKPDILVVTVADSGIGLSEDDCKIIFEEFRQVDSSASRLFPGSGLGLSIAKRLTELLLGQISVTSEVGKGSSFHVRIPKSFSPKTLDVRKSMLVPPSTVDSVAMLIRVSDSLLNKLLPSLQESGYDIIQYDSGSNSERSPARLTPDIIITEISESHELNSLETAFLLEQNDINSKAAQVFFIRARGSDTYSMFRLQERIQYYDGIPHLNTLLSDFASAADGELKKPLIFSAGATRVRYKTLSFQQSREILLRGDSICHFIIHRKKDIDELINALNADTAIHPSPSFYAAKDPEVFKYFLNPEFLIKFVPPGLFSEEEFQVLLRRDVVAGEKKIINSTLEALKHLSDEKNMSGAEKIMSVLVADDDPDSLFTITEIMKECGFTVMTAQNGIECLRCLEKDSPSIILLDIMMPEMDGFQTLKRIRENPLWSRIPVLAVTAKAMLDERTTIYKSGFDGFVAKPIVAGVLAYKVTKLLTEGK